MEVVAKAAAEATINHHMGRALVTLQAGQMEDGANREKKSD